MASQISYYSPYDSGSETGSETEDTGSQLTDETADTGDISEQESTFVAGPNFRALAEGLGAVTFDSSGQQLFYEQMVIGNPITTGFSTYQSLELPTDPSGELLKSVVQETNSIIMLDSRDRDRNVFPQPTLVTLRLPRVYSNVTSFQVVQIKLLSSFFYFRLTKRNTDMTIHEFGRTVTNSQGQLIDDLVTKFIRPGSYDINSLMSEITTQLNFTPLFYDFPHGFQDFATRFASTGDFSLNFNFPGDTYYDSLLNQFIENPTMSQIVSKYFVSQYAGQSSYTTDQIKVAYYYPVIKEVLLDERFSAATPLNLDVNTAALLPGETVRSRCIYTFQGLNDVIVQEVIAANIPLLDTYRLQHTFRYFLVNKYNVTLEPQSSRITISSPSLNTSLLNLLAYKQAQFFAQELAAQGITEDQYNTLQAQNTVLLAIVNDMFYYIQQYLATYFGIPFNTYDISYIANPEYTVPIRDATQAVGISSNYDLAALLRNQQPITQDILAPLQSNAPQYWNRIKNLPGSTVSFPYNLETGNPATSSNYPYSIALDKQDRDHKFIDATSTMYTNKLLRYTDVLLPLDATEYTVFQFNSPVRQTLQVATLPRPTKYRYPAYNTVAYSASTQQLFDNSYAFVTNAYNSNMDVQGITLGAIPGFSTLANSNFAVNYSTATSFWSTSSVTNFIGNTRSFYTFQAPYPSPNLSSIGYRYPLSVTLATKDTTSTFVTPMNMYLYHDRGAFMADISDNRNEKPIHYLAAVSTTTDISAASITINAYAGQTYYVLSRTQELAVPTQRYRIVPWYPQGSTCTALTSSLTGFNPLADPTTSAALSNFNYAALADPAFIRLPISSNLMPSTVVDPLFTPLTFSTVAIGYDAAGVSTDLTDYQGFIPESAASNVAPKSQIRIDPVNGYLFQALSPYSQSTQTYFYSTSSNAILTSNGTNVYTPASVAQRQYSAVHWYSDTYLPNSSNQAPILSNTVANPTYLKPYTTTTTQGAPLSGYTYAGSNGGLQFDDGVLGISFAPDQGVWAMDRVMFKSAYTTSNLASDSNLAIDKLGVFFASKVTNGTVGDLSLNQAAVVLKKASTMCYSNASNFGFDPVGGTYYEYVADSTYSNSNVYGYSQIRGEFNPDSNALYTIVPFNALGRPVFYQALAGSAVPYPYYSDASAGTAYFDGNQPINGRGIVLPTTKATPDSNRGPPAGYDQTQSKYELSMPIGTNLLTYASPYSFITAADAMKAWSPLPYAPSLVVTDVSGFVLTQDSFFRVFQYTTDTANSTFIERYQFTLDQVVETTNSNVEYIGTAANENSYAFFAYSNDLGTPSNSKILVTTMTPGNGYAQNKTEFQTPFVFSASQLTSLTYTNGGGFTMAVNQGSSLYTYAKWGSNQSLLLSNTVANSNIQYLKTQQSPKEAAGRFYVFPVRTTGVTDYVYVDPTSTIGSENPNYEFGARRADTTVPALSVFNLSNATVPNLFRSPVVTRQPFQDFITLLSPQTPTKIYRVTSYTASNDAKYTSNAIVTQSAYSFPAATSNLFAGANGALWALRGTILYGNRNDYVDAPRSVQQAWQIFYPVQRIVFRQIAKNFTFMRDLTGLQYAEYPHTAIAGYTSSTKLLADISGRWGLESASNFSVADFGFSGEYFNGSIVSFPLKPSTTNFLAIRNYSPTEKSQVLLRCSLNNRYDFGYVTLTDVSNEVVTAATASNKFDPDYYTQLLGYNSTFIFPSGRVFGAGVIAGFNGSNISSTGFGNFYSTFQGLYTQYNTQVQLVQTINSNVNAALSNFIATDLQYILPSTVLNRQRYTDPLSFSIKWKSSLFPQYARLEEEWGLGWNLGFTKVDTPYDTVQQASSFFKILDDFINLRLNPEFDMNRMDTGSKENLSASQETTGVTKAFHAKLLLAPFGSYAQTLISNPLAFSPPLGRIDKLTFNWVDVTSATIDNADCEWNMVVQVVERKEVTEFNKKPRVIGPS